MISSVGSSGSSKEVEGKYINKFTKEEDLKLLRLVKKFKEKNWKKISSHFQNKNYIQCFSRFKRIRPGLRKGFWTKEEDQILLSFVEKYGRKWALIAKEFKTRNGKQIRDRFINILDPLLNRGPFSEFEDFTIIKLYNLYGSKWAKIAKECKTKRSPDLVKNRFYSHLKGKKKLVDFEFSSTLQTEDTLKPAADAQVDSSLENLEIFGSGNDTITEADVTKEINLDEISHICYTFDNMNKDAFILV